MLALATIASQLSPLELIGDYTWTSPGRSDPARGALRRRNKGGEKAAALAACARRREVAAAGTSDERNPLCA